MEVTRDRDSASLSYSVDMNEHPWKENSSHESLEKKGAFEEVDLRVPRLPDVRYVCWTSRFNVNSTNIGWNKNTT